MEVARIFVPNFQRKQAVLDLMAKYDIEEDEWAYETIIKNLQRRAERYETENLFCREMSYNKKQAAK
jgi:hypothetical protein